jgi:Lrp/AsnC family leucine-responsive transcriptional regulator
MPTITLNRTDRRLLEILQKDGHLTNLELASQVNLSPSACLTGFVTVKLEKRGRMPTDAFARAVQAWPEVMACHAMTGEMDYLLRVQVEDLDHFSRFVMDHLLKHPGVLDVKSSFVLEAVKETTALPLGHLG